MPKPVSDQAAEAFDDEILVWLAHRFGKPVPTEGQCVGIRNMVRDKVKQAETKGLKTYHISCDGQNVFIYTSNADALAKAFDQKHNWMPDVSREQIIVEYQILLHRIEVIQWSLSSSLIGYQRQKGVFGNDNHSSPVEKIRKKQDEHINRIRLEIEMELYNIVNDLGCHSL